MVEDIARACTHTIHDALAESFKVGSCFMEKVNSLARLRGNERDLKMYSFVKRRVKLKVIKGTPSN